jgi:hypothetical protein
MLLALQVLLQFFNVLLTAIVEAIMTTMDHLTMLVAVILQPIFNRKAT